MRTASNTAFFEMHDHGQTGISAETLIKGSVTRDSHGQAARLAHQFLSQNRGILRDFGVLGQVGFDGSSVEIHLSAGNKVGAIPLLSPTSGRPDYGLVVKPRFGWQGIGPMLGTMGWKVLPSPLPLPLLPRSDRKVPPWVLSSTVLLRLRHLLDSLDRRFELVQAEVTAPRGQVQWTEYATAKVSRADFLRIPCRFPDLRDDSELKSTIHHTLLRQLASLQSQRTAGLVVMQLIQLCHDLLQRVSHVPARAPSKTMLNRWLRGEMRTDIFRDGIQAVEWTVDERGLAGLGDLQGVPWVLPMDQFFEAWVETLAGQLARRAGGKVKSGRARQTVTPLGWSPPYVGSQKYLLPDIVIEREQETIIFDAKYKSHWEEISSERWGALERELQESHRSDLLQVLAYSTVAESKRVVACLVYPCHAHTWRSLLARGRPYHKAAVRAGTRQVDLVLTAAPMGLAPEEICAVLNEAISA